ncbi:MAG: rhomboid family intramembrane serine protease [Ignavibacteria bacterium]
MGLFSKEQDRYKNYDYRYNRPSMFGGFAFFPPVIKYLLISNVAVFLLQYFILPSFQIGGQPAAYIFLKYFALNPIGSILFPFYPWQLITYMFMHGGFLHIFLNMFALWMFGMELENIWGSQKFFGYYMICGIGAGLANLFIAPLFTTMNMPTIGASGAIYGVLVAFGLMFPERPIFIYFLFPIRAKYFVLIYMAIELLSVGSTSGIAHVAHLGGGVVGFLYILITTKTNFTDFFRSLTRPKTNSPQTPRYTYSNKYYEKYNYDPDNVSDAQYHINDKNEDQVSQERIDEILDKISKEGYKNLTEEEKRILFEASKKIH